MVVKIFALAFLAVVCWLFLGLLAIVSLDMLDLLKERSRWVWVVIFILGPAFLPVCLICAPILIAKDIYRRNHQLGIHEPPD